MLPVALGLLFGEKEKEDSVGSLLVFMLGLLLRTTTLGALLGTDDTDDTTGILLGTDDTVGILLVTDDTVGILLGTDDTDDTTGILLGTDDTVGILLGTDDTVGILLGADVGGALGERSPVVSIHPRLIRYVNIFSHRLLIDNKSLGGVNSTPKSIELYTRRYTINEYTNRLIVAE